jgi:hypothetical protein
MYGMTKTTIYLPVRLKKAVERAAAATGASEAAVIRAAIEQATHDVAGPRPRLPLFHSRNQADLAARTDDALRGDGATAFGDR